MTWAVEMDAAFGAAFALVFYSYFGYPLLLALLKRLHPAPPVRKEPVTPAVSVVIVAHNEEARIEAKLRNCLALEYPKDRLEIVIASDGSTDRTEEIVRRFAADGVRLVSLPGPNGKPHALNQVVPQVRGEIVVLCDARQELARDAVRQLVANLADPTVGAVSGELHIHAESGSGSGEGVGAYWTYEKWIRRSESQVDSTVGVTGAIYALRRDLFRPLDPRTILDDVAIPMEVVRAGYRVVFEPEARAYDKAADDPRKEYRRKVRTLAGNYQLVAFRPGLLHPWHNRIFWQLVSHKLSRLAVPWCLLAMLAASAVRALQGSLFHGAALVAQVIFYLLAAAGWGLERLSVRVKLLSIPYAFTLLNLAAASSLFGFLSGRQRAAWKGAA